jgi:thiamine-phosphate diphosphorylase/hydroxyethylthiazole kinase
MPLSEARRLLCPSAIIGVSVNNVQQAKAAIEGGADYLGIAPCYATMSKKDIKGLLGPRGVADILEAVGNSNVRCVTIGEGTRSGD